MTRPPTTMPKMALAAMLDPEWRFVSATFRRSTDASPYTGRPRAHDRRADYRTSTALAQRVSTTMQRASEQGRLRGAPAEMPSAVARSVTARLMM